MYHTYIRMVLENVISNVATSNEQTQLAGPETEAFIPETLLNKSIDLANLEMTHVL